MIRVYTNWSQGTTSALMSTAIMWKSRHRYGPKLVYSVSVLLFKVYLGMAKRSSLSAWPLYK